MTHCIYLFFTDPDCAIEQDSIGRSAITYAVHFQQMDALHCLLDNQLDVNMTAHGKYYVTN